MLHLTKIAYGAESPATLRQWLESHGDQGEALLTTRYLPKRLEELAGGSLYWIHSHVLVGRSPIVGFSENGSGRFWIRLEPRLIPVQPVARRAHQGWRYLSASDAPADITQEEAEAIPHEMAGELRRLGLL